MTIYYWIRKQNPILQLICTFKNLLALHCADIGKTWFRLKNQITSPRHISENGLSFPFLQPLVISYFLITNACGLNIILPLTKFEFVLCQIVSRNALKASPNEEIKNLWSVTRNYKNVQYDTYKST